MRAASPKTASPTKAQRLREAGAAQNERHRDEWAQLRGRFAARKDEIYRDSRDQIKREVAAHKAANKPVWAEHFKQERRDRKEITRMESSLSGRFALAVVAARSERAEGNKASFATLVVANLISKGHRDAVFDRVFERGRKGLSDRLQSRLDDRLKPIIERRGFMLESASRQNKQERAALRERQEPEKSAIREAWRELRRADRAAEQTREAPRAAERGQEARSHSDRSSGPERGQKAVREPENRAAGRFGWLDRQKEAQERKPEREQERQSEKQDRFGWLNKSQDERAAEQRERNERERGRDYDRDR